MKKLSKVIIVFLFCVLCLCTYVVPTYCLTSKVSNDYFSIRNNEWSVENNYYNLQNIQYVTLSNFDIEFNYSYGYHLMDCRVNDYLGTIPETRYDVVQDVYIQNTSPLVKIGQLYMSYIVSLESSGYFVIKTDRSYNKFVPDPNAQLFLKPSELLDFNIFRTYTILIPYLPYEILDNNYNFFDYPRLYQSLYVGCSLSFDINYNDQYYYNDTFSIACGSALPFFINQGTFTDYNKTIQFTDNHGNIFSQVVNDLDSDIKNSLARVFTIKNDYNFENCYYTNFKIKDEFSRYYLASLDPMSSIDLQYYCSYRFNIGNNDTTTNHTFFLISNNSKDYTDSSSTLIPLGSNNYYKDCEWWDIPSHLYNFFIFLVFDAPIISDFSNLVLVLVGLVVEFFSFIIGLFTGINSAFFVAIFVGFIVLSFLFKIIFKG